LVWVDQAKLKYVKPKSLAIARLLNVLKAANQLQADRAALNSD